MKKVIYCSILTLIITGLFSCKSNENSVFSKRKYYHFKNGDNEVALNKPQTKEPKAIEINKAPEQVATTNTNIFSNLLINNKTAAITTKAIASKEKIVKVNHALTTINNIDKNEKIAAAQKSTQPTKQNTTNNNSSSEVQMVVLIILAILLPPLAVYLKEGSVGPHFWVDLILSLFFWVPGIIFAFLVILDVI